MFEIKNKIQVCPPDCRSLRMMPGLSGHGFECKTVIGTCVGTMMSSEETK
jgi:hypothetical protein